HPPKITSPITRLAIGIIRIHMVDPPLWQRSGPFDVSSEAPVIRDSESRAPSIVPLNAAALHRATVPARVLSAPSPGAFILSGREATDTAPRCHAYAATRRCPSETASGCHSHGAP